LQALQARLIQVRIHRIDLLHRGQERRGTRLHVRTLRYRRGADASGDGRSDIRVAQIDARRLHGRLARGDIGCGLSSGRDGVVVVLFGYAIAGEEYFVPLHQRGRRGKRGLRAFDCRRGAVQRRAIRRRIDLEQSLMRLDVTAFLEIAHEHNAVDAPANLGHGYRRSAAGKLHGRGDAGLVHRHH
jgi:hypothetical protein